MVNLHVEIGSRRLENRRSPQSTKMLMDYGGWRMVDEDDEDEYLDDYIDEGEDAMVTSVKMAVMTIMLMDDHR